MLVTVFGANGDSGKAIVKSLVEKGHSIVAAVRRPESVVVDDAEKIRVEKIDFSDPATIRKALEGSDAVVSAVGSGKLRAARDPTTVYSTATRILRQVMRELKIKRLVVLSSCGVDEEPEHFSWVYSNIIRRYIMNSYIDMARMETILEETPPQELDWTSVRLSYLCEGESQPYLVKDKQMQQNCSYTIHFCDVGKFVATELEENRWIHKMPVLTYP